MQNITDITVDKQGNWFIGGQSYEKKNLTRDFDMVINTIKGGEGEDGRISKYLNTFGVKHNNANFFGSTLSHNKHEFKKFLKRHEIKTPYHVVVDKNFDVESQKRQMHQKMFLPAIVKPATNGSAIGVFLAYTFDELNQYIDFILRRDRFAIIEEYIDGLDASVLIMPEFREQELYSFIPVGIDTPDIIKYENKFNNSHTFFPIHNLSLTQKNMIEDIAKTIHSKLDLDTLTMTDFRVHPKRGVYVLETNTVPSYENQSIYDESLKLVGVSEDELVEHIIKTALNRRKN